MRLGAGIDDVAYFVKFLEILDKNRLVAANWQI
jgi:hypothetical protein